MDIKFNIHSYDTELYPFKEFIEKLYKVNKLEKLHELKPELLPNEKLKFENEASTKFHKIFYDKLNSK